MDLPMTNQEIKNLGMNIRSLPAEFLKGVWEIVSNGKMPSNSEVLSFDIVEIDARK